MFKLAKNEPEWVTLIPAAGGLPAVEAQFAPITVKAVRASRRAIREAFGVNPDDIEEAGDAMSRELIRRGMLAWRGIGADDTDDDVQLDFTPENVELFLADPRTFEAADRAYVLPWVNRDREGNASAGSPNGISAEATPATITASSRAKRKPGGAAKPARTGSTSRKLTKARQSGTSSRSARRK